MKIKHHNEKQILKAIEDFHNSNLSCSEICTKHNCDRNAFFYYMRKHKANLQNGGNIKNEVNQDIFSEIKQDSVFTRNLLSEKKIKQPKKISRDELDELSNYQKNNEMRNLTNYVSDAGGYERTIKDAVPKTTTKKEFSPRTLCRARPETNNSKIVILNDNSKKMRAYKETHDLGIISEEATDKKPVLGAATTKKKKQIKSMSREEFEKFCDEC